MNRKVVLNIRNMTPGGMLAAGSILVGGLPASFTPAPSTLDSTGATTVTVTIPSGLAEGDQFVQITDSAAMVSSGTYTVTKPTITLSPSEQTRGQAVVVNGLGWVPNSSVSITAAPGTAFVKSLSATPDANGAFNASFAVPIDINTDANYSVTAHDSINTADAATLRVPAAAVTVTPETAPWGEDITVKGVGFDILAPVQIDVDGNNQQLSVTPYTDRMGNFTAVFPMPGLREGAHTVGATVGSVRATITVNVVEAAATVESVLASVAGKYTIVWHFESATQKWQFYAPEIAAQSTLSTLEKGKGYLIKAGEPASFTYGANTYNLVPGWNSLGWLG
jgi:hypothetical protein